MFLPRLRFTFAAQDKLGRRNITPEQVLQAGRNRPALVPNPRGRVAESRLMIGPDDGGRILTVVVEPLSGGSWLVRTAWPARRAQIVVYRRLRK